eukprot:2046101-Ditylum_brightwellii.AAC.1
MDRLLIVHLIIPADVFSSLCDATMSCHIKYHSSLWARGAVLTQNTSSSIIISRVIVVSSSCVISSKGKLEAV